MKSLIKKLFFSFFLTLIFLVLIGIFLFLYYSKDLPDPKSLDSRVIPQSTKIYDRTGKILLYEIHLGEKRTLVKLNEISPYAIKATLAAEDHRFFKHHGFVFQGIIRGIIKSILNPSQVQGGSTITNN